MTSAATKPGAKILTADDLLRLYSEGVRGELIRGCYIKQWRQESNMAK